MSAKFGPSGNSASFYSSGKKHTYEAPLWLSQMGLDCYEYSAGNGITGSAATFQKIGEEAKKHNIAMSFHTPYYISLSGTDPEKRLKSLDYIRRSLEASHALGATIIVIHSGSAAKISRTDALYLAKDTMWKALEAFPDIQFCQKIRKSMYEIFVHTLIYLYITFPCLHSFFFYDPQLLAFQI